MPCGRTKNHRLPAASGFSHSTSSPLSPAQPQPASHLGGSRTSDLSTDDSPLFRKVRATLPPLTE